jgi:hypothetical protein
MTQSSTPQLATAEDILERLLLGEKLLIRCDPSTGSSLRMKLSSLKYRQEQAWKTAGLRFDDGEIEKRKRITGEYDAKKQQLTLWLVEDQLFEIVAVGSSASSRPPENY